MKSRRKPLVALLLAAGVAIIFSGCFTWSSFKWSSTVVKPGRSTTAVIGMTPAGEPPPPNKDVPFILVGFSDTTQLKLGKTRKWDTEGKFGGPLKLFSDGALRTAALSADACKVSGQPLSQIADVIWSALRTDKTVNDKDRVGKIATTRIAIKAASNATDHQEQIYFLGGGWQDDGDANPEPEEVGCGGGTFTTLTITG
jgi:hypothetical protein